MSRDSGSWRSAWRQTPEPPTAASPGPPPIPVVSSSHPVVSFVPPGRVVPPPLLWLDAPGSRLPWCVHVLCALNSLCPASTPNPGQLGAWPAAAPPGHRVARSKPGHQVSFSTCFAGRGDGQALLLEQISQWVTLLPPGDIRPCLETVLVVNNWGIRGLK